MAGDIDLLFGDEAEALTHPYLAHCLGEARRPTCGSKRRGGRASARSSACSTTRRGELIVITSGTKRSRRLRRPAGPSSTCVYGPTPGRVKPVPVVLVLDNGPIHIEQG